MLLGILNTLTQDDMHIMYHERAFSQTRHHVFFRVIKLGNIYLLSNQSRVEGTV